MEITVVIPPNVEEYLRTYAASLFYETSPYALSKAIFSALINEMNSAGLINRDAVVLGILEESKPQVPTPQVQEESKPQVPTPQVQEESKPQVPIPQVQEVVELPAPSIPKPDLDSSVAVVTDPMKLKIPREQFHGDVSNTWLVWGWCVSSGLHLNARGNSTRKLRKFRLQDVLQGVMQQKGIHIKETTVYSALDVLVKRQWLIFIETSKRYTLSPIAEEWAVMPQNQAYLIEKGFLGLPEESDMIYK